MWTWTLIIGALASIALADRMARTRGRSPTIWFGIAFLAGPLAPLALFILGEAKHPAPRTSGNSPLTFMNAQKQ